MTTSQLRWALFIVLLNVYYSFKANFPSLTHQTRINPFRIQRYLSSTSKGPSIAESTTNAGAPTVLKCEGITKSFTGVPQFQSVSLNLAKGQRVGLIGVNGAGKSTLLKCLSKIESIDSGTIESASNANIIYVDQEPDWGNISVFQALFAGTDLASTTNQKYFALLKDEENMDTDELAKITDAMEVSNGWEYQERGLNIATKLNIPEAYLYRQVTSLSGGERKRVGLAAALLKQPDVLLLDEVIIYHHPF